MSCGCGCQPRGCCGCSGCPCCNNCNCRCGYNYLPRNVPLALGQPSNGGCCCRYRVPEDIPLAPPPCTGPPQIYYRPRPRCPQRCTTPGSCFCHPCTAPPPCCRPGAYNPRCIPPGVCPPPCCCQPCRVPPKCMPPPCRRCNRPCCPKPPLLPIPSWQPRMCPSSGPTVRCNGQVVSGDDSCQNQEGDSCCCPDPVSIKYKSLNVEVRVSEDKEQNRRTQQQVQEEQACCQGQAC